MEKKVLKVIKGYVLASDMYQQDADIRWGYPADTAGLADGAWP
jgi:hypothetical protein